MVSTSDCKASRKIMIFPFHSGPAAGAASFENLAEVCARAARPIDRKEQYLLLGWPWSVIWAERMDKLRIRTLS